MSIQTFSRQRNVSLSKLLLESRNWRTGDKATWTPFPVNNDDIVINSSIFEVIDYGKILVKYAGDYLVVTSYYTDIVSTNSKYIFSIKENDLMGDTISYLDRGYTDIAQESQVWSKNATDVITLPANKVIQVSTFTEFSPVDGRKATLSLVKI